MDNQPVSADVYAGWTKARLDLLRGSVERVFALLSASRVDDEAWRAAVAGGLGVRASQLVAEAEEATEDVDG